MAMLVCCIDFNLTQTPFILAIIDLYLAAILNHEISVHGIRFIENGQGFEGIKSIKLKFDTRNSLLRIVKGAETKPENFNLIDYRL